jgi:hypothetical protein
MKAQLVLGSIAFSVATAGCGASVGGDVTQSGQIVSFGTTIGVANVRVALGDRGGTTDPNGLYAVRVPKDSPYEMTLTAPGYLKVIAQEWKISDDVDRGSTNFVPESQWATFIPGFESIGGVPSDSTLGFVALLVVALPPCPTTGGATVSIAPSVPTTRYLYVDDSGAPSTNASTSAKPLSIHVLMYNVPVGQVTVSITSPSCSQAPWPVTTEVTPGGGAFTDTGNARIESGSAISYLRIYLGP